MNNKENKNKFNAHDEIEVMSILRTIKRGKKLVFGIIFISTIFTGIYSYRVKPIFKGSFNIVVKKFESNSRSFPNALQGLSPLIGKIRNTENETQKLILKSESVLMPVFNFVQNYYKEKNISSNLYFKKWLEENLNIEFENESSVLKVEYINTDKELILKALNLISSKYKDYSKRDAEKQITETIAYLEKQTKLMKEKTLKSIKEFNNFSIENGLGSIDGFVDITSSSFSSQTKRNLSNLNLSEINLSNNFDLSNNLNLSDQITKLKGSASGSSNKAGIRFNNQFRLLEKYEASYVDLSSQLKPNSSTLKSLSKKIENLRSALKRPNEILLTYSQLKTEADRNQSILQELENSLQILNLNKIKTPDAWELISKPTLDIKPIFPNKKLLILASIIISFLISSVITIIKEKLSGKIFELDDYKLIIKYSFLNMLYKNNQNINWKILNNSVKISKTEELAIVNLSDNFFDKSNDKENNFLKNIDKINFINLENIDMLEKFEKVILIVQKGNLTKSNLSLIETYLFPYEGKIQGWFFLE